jgi:hypothetical protein
MKQGDTTKDDQGFAAGNKIEISFYKIILL